MEATTEHTHATETKHEEHSAPSESSDRTGLHLTTKAAEKVLSGAVGQAPASEDEILRRVQDGLAQEIRIMLDEGVVPEVEDIDLCLILGAGWPFIDGGASPYLDREGASERVFGDTFHHPPIRGIGG